MPSSNESNRYPFLQPLASIVIVEDLEEDIYGAKVGEIVGPFDGGNNMYLLKIVQYDTKACTKIRKVQLIPKGNCKTDNALFDKYLKKYSDAIGKGKNIRKTVNQLFLRTSKKAKIIQPSSLRR